MAKKRKPGAGRPTVMTDVVVGKLEQAFTLGCTSSEACVYAGISRNALYDYVKIHPEFSNRKELLKNMPGFLARNAITEKLREGDIATARWMIDKIDGKAKQAVELTGKEGGPVQTDNKIRITFVGMDDDA